MPADQPPIFFGGEDMDSTEQYSGSHNPITPVNLPDDYAPISEFGDFSFFPSSWDAPGGDGSAYLPLDQYHHHHHHHQMYVDTMSSFDSFDLPGGSSTTTAPSSYAPSSYLSRDTTQDWGTTTAGTRTGSVSTANTSTDSPVTEFSYLGGPADTAELDRVPDLIQSSSSRPAAFPSSAELHSPLLPADDTTPLALPVLPKDRKRGSIVQPADGPSKRSCVGGTTDGGPATRSKEKPASNSQKRKSAASTRKSSESDKSKSGSVSRAAEAASSSRSGSGSSGAAHKAAQLRTASRKPKSGKDDSSGGVSPTTTRGENPDEKDAEKDDDDLTPDERRARHSHNLVEKQYRNRLNQHFEDLLTVLSSTENSGGGGTMTFSTGGGGGKTNKAREGGKGFSAVDGGGGGGADDRRLSKAEVLDMARKRILALAQECDRHKSEKVELAARYGLARNEIAKKDAQAINR